MIPNLNAIDFCKIVVFNFVMNDDDEILASHGYDFPKPLTGKQIVGQLLSPRIHHLDKMQKIEAVENFVKLYEIDEGNLSQEHQQKKLENVLLALSKDVLSKISISDFFDMLSIVEKAESLIPIVEIDSANRQIQKFLSEFTFDQINNHPLVVKGEKLSSIAMLSRNLPTEKPSDYPLLIATRREILRYKFNFLERIVYCNSPTKFELPPYKLEQEYRDFISFYSGNVKIESGWDEYSTYNPIAEIHSFASSYFTLNQIKEIGKILNKHAWEEHDVRFLDTPLMIKMMVIDKVPFGTIQEMCNALRIIIEEIDRIQDIITEKLKILGKHCEPYISPENYLYLNGHKLKLKKTSAFYILRFLFKNKSISFEQYVLPDNNMYRGDYQPSYTKDLGRKWFSEVKRPLRLLLEKKNKIISLDDFIFSDDKTSKGGRIVLRKDVHA